MLEVSTIGLDIAKSVFHAHGADERGVMVFSRKLTRGKLLEFFARQPRCTVALEACGGAHHWARELQAMGHAVRLIPPAYVKPFVKRHKNDAIDAEAICEAAQRPGMRFVAVKSEEQQAAGLVFRTRDLIVRQRTQLINAIRGRLTEYGWVAPRGTAHMTLLAEMLEDDEMASSLPAEALPMLRLMVDLLTELDRRVATLDREIARRAKEDEAARRLMTIPGIGPIAATAILALAPPIETFARSRDFAAWLGLAPRQHLARDIATTDAYLVSRRQRKKVEMLFAHLKRILKLDRLRLRGPNGARDEFHLAAAAQNLRKMAKIIPMARTAKA